MITVTEERYDGVDAVALVQELFVDLGVRYKRDGSPEDADVDPGQVSRPHGVFLVARLEDRPVGCGALKPLDGSSEVAEVKRMYTVPAARRRGVSRRVLARLEGVALELGYGRVQLETGTGQPEALALYEAAGWHRIETYGRYRDDPLSVCFAKRLA